MTIIISYRLPNDAIVASELSQAENQNADVATCIKTHYDRGDVAYSLAKLGRIQALRPRINDMVAGTGAVGSLIYEPHYITDKIKLVVDGSYSYLYQNDGWQVHIPNGGMNWLPLKDETIAKISEIETKKYNDQKRSRNEWYNYQPMYLPHKNRSYNDLWEQTWIPKDVDYKELEKRIMKSIKGKK